MTMQVIWFIIVHLLNLTTTFRSCLDNHGLKVNCLYRSFAICSQGNYRWPYFNNAAKINLEILYINWERQCANGELLQVRQRSVGNIEKRNVIKMTICVQTVNGVIRIKNSSSSK